MDKGYYDPALTFSYYETPFESQSTIKMDKGYYKSKVYYNSSIVPSQSTIKMDKGYYTKTANPSTTSKGASRNPQ